MIKIEKLTKKYKGEYALKNASFEAKQHEVVAIVGPSGSGKTTLLRCINHLEEPTSGDVYLDGDKITKRNRSKISLKVGMVFQHSNLFPHMSVIENLTYAPCKVLRQNTLEAQKKASTILSQFSIKAKATSMPSQLSGGQKQRVAIARALMMDPEVMLFDEPTSALDPEVIKDVAEAINDLKNKTTIIVVTHHLKFARAVADRIIFMDQGQILCDQKTDEFFAEPNSHRARLFLENVGDFL
jgi:polar amino acid transport system ATP-binding protein